MTQLDPIPHLARLLTLAAHFVGVSLAPTCPRRAELLALLDPLGPPATHAWLSQRDVDGAANSTCGLFVAGLLRRLLRDAGVVTRLERPLDASQGWYHDTVALAREHGALTVGWRPLRPGDAVHVTSYTGAQHWYVVETVDHDGAIQRVTSIDGGQLDGGRYQAIARVQRVTRGAWDETSSKSISQIVDLPRLLAAITGGQPGSDDPKEAA